jgi:Asp-tRNA(Asn)/Glu-tRNA(Gln) amidotransferase A subunit family amidase
MTEPPGADQVSGTARALMEKAANAADRPLFGVPVTVKDLTVTAGIPASFAGWAGYKPPQGAVSSVGGIPAAARPHRQYAPTA